MPGDEIAVRTRQRYPRVRIVVLSADVSVENFNRARAAGADRCLGKPARVADVRRALHETGVLPARFEVARLERAYDLVTRGDAAGRGEAEDLIRAVYRDAAEFTESLRDDPASDWLFALAHRNLSGSLVYAADLAATDPGTERSRQLLLQCLSSAINWEDT
jgi:CheY-like chemotaxis protein